jgi:predicted small lipoprotein YifL
MLVQARTSLAAAQRAPARRTKTLRRVMFGLAFALAAGSLAGCGQKGPLTLPGAAKAASAPAASAPGAPAAAPSAPPSR